MKYLAFLGLLAVTLSACAQESAVSHGVAAAELSPSYILDSMKKVADWQLTNGSPSDTHYKYPRNGWTWAAFYDGVMALDSIAGTPKYHDAMVEVGKKFDWQPAQKIYFADDQAVGQLYLELYMKDRDPAMLKPIKD